MIKSKRKLTAARFLVLGYLVVILAGSLLLCLPISSAERVWTPFVDSLFTATSATCVTGLIVYDTYIHWSLFGQIVIILLIQIGGVGFMTVITMFSMFLRRKIGLYERKVLMQSAGTGRIGGMLHLIKRILLFTLVFELFGAIVLATRFVGDFGWARGIYFSVFHAVSAFCNAGFDLMGYWGTEFASLTRYAGDPVVNLAIMFLIVVGGLGFVVWGDVVDCRFRFKKYALHTKIVIIFTLALIFGSAVIFFFSEANHAFKGFDTGERILAAFFHAISPRTAGFNTAPMDKLSEGGLLWTVVLMFIGGNTGSTAGGVKITTVVVAIMGLFAAAKNDTSATVAKKNVNTSLILQAFAIIGVYLVMVIVSVMLLSFAEPFAMEELLFEVVSAIGTVGLTTGITPYLTAFSKVLLALLMFSGRVGAFSLLSAIAEKRENPPVKRPDGKIFIG